MNGSDRLSPVARGRDALFVYGTLMFPVVVKGLLGRVPPARPAGAVGWRVAALSGRVYPGLVAAPGRAAAGQLVVDLSPDEWRVLDEFEDAVYDLRRLELDHDRAGWAYAWGTKDDVEEADWDAERFAREDLTEYTRRWAQGDDERSGRPGTRWPSTHASRAGWSPWT